MYPVHPAAESGATTDVVTSSANPHVENPSNIEPEQRHDQEWKPQKQELLIMGTMAITSLLVALDASILTAALPTIANDLQGTATEAFWAVTSYLLANAAVQPFLAALSDVFGRRELLVPSTLLFTIGNAIGGAAHNFAMLLAGRVIQGIGGGGLICLAQIVFADIVPLRQRPRFFALILVAWALGLLMGPIVGGAFTQDVSWRWCFYINLPFCGVALPMTYFFVKLVPPERKTLMEKVRLVDWTGGFLFTTGLTAFLVAITNGGHGQAWSSWRTILPLVIGIVLIIITAVHERFWAKNPFLQHSLFPHVSAVATYIVALISGMLLLMSSYYLTLYIAASELVNPLTAAVRTLPVVAFSMLSSPVISAMITRFGSYRWGIWAGFSTTTLGCGLLIDLDEHSSQAKYSGYLVVLGLGLGMILSSVNFASQAAVLQTIDSGRAAVMYAFMRTVGFCVGIAAGGAIFVNAMAAELRRLDLPVEIADDAEAYLAGTLPFMPDSDPRKADVLRAYAVALRAVFIAMTAISGAALAVSVVIKHYSLDRILESRYAVERQEVQQDEEKK